MCVLCFPVCWTRRRQGRVQDCVWVFECVCVCAFKYVYVYVNVGYCVCGLLCMWVVLCEGASACRCLCMWVDIYMLEGGPYIHNNYVHALYMHTYMHTHVRIDMHMRIQ